MDWSGFDWDCTAAFGVRDSQRECLLTAEHCYDTGDVIEDMNGDVIGGVDRVNQPYDAALIRAGDSQQGVWANDDLVYNVRNTALSWDGELVSESGYTSYPNRCGIEVTNELITWTDDQGKQRWGVEGHKCDGCAVVAHGHSGGPVWSIYDGPGGGVVARGIISAGHTPVQQGVSYAFIMWTEVPPAARALGVTVITS